MRSVRASRSLTNRQVSLLRLLKRSEGQGDLNRMNGEASNARSVRKRVTMASKNEEEEEQEEKKKKEEEREVYSRKVRKMAKRR